MRVVDTVVIEHKIDVERIAYLQWCCKFLEWIGAGEYTGRLGYYEYLDRRQFVSEVIREIKKDREVREYMETSLAKVAKGEMTVAKEFKVTGAMKRYVKWLIDNGGVIGDNTTYKKLSDACGISENMLLKWYHNPEFVIWIRQETKEKLGFAVDILKTNMVMNALKPEATDAQKKFALELLGESTGQSGTTINLTMFGQKVQVHSEPEKIEDEHS